MLFTADGRFDLTVWLVIDQPVDVVLFGEAFDEFLFMLTDAALEVIGNASLEDAGSAGEDVDVVNGHWADCGTEVAGLSSGEVGA